jgi:predicted small integral membrane protein
MRSSHLLRIALVAMVLTIAPFAHPQGCTQCRDNTAATPPKTQAAYRHAIILMALTASGLFLGTVALLKRQP